MESLIGYGSDDDVETERSSRHAVVGSSRRREDDTNYDDVNMDLSEESQSVESEPELPPAASSTRRSSREHRRESNDTRERDRTRDMGRDRNSDDMRDRDRHRDGPRERERDCLRDRERDGPRDRRRDERERRSPKRDDRHRDRFRGAQDSRRGLLGDRPDEKTDKMPALTDLKPYDGEPPPGRGHDARDAVSPRFTERGRRERDRERERERGRDRDNRHSQRSDERRSGRNDRSRSRGAAYPPPQALASDRDRRGSPPSADYRPSSYKVNRKLDVMEKMGLQIKTPDGSMATAQQLRAAASEAPSGLPPYYNPAAVHSNKALDQKRKLLWSHKEKSESTAACWSGARFAQDADGKQVSKFMRLMGIKDAAATAKPEAAVADPNKKQEELFQAMQAQYEVARATTHTMRGVGLGFQRGNY
ncbi:arginine/serine-rich coiled-coil protein 2 isoform X2 [Danaus plexippus]|uniref:Uncharacterized protein n=1 Tax=Danaus plexippus plexippus TaxID=278856 RepID=A0A212FMZ5_DANPL|nr:arginine/serine-rich coiled-coil protein 2 isoform X2 [Danaus plexippus]OWR55108.1 hypothetical protein KGM_206834 [Danaus plexippus plexippus]